MKTLTSKDPLMQIFCAHCENPTDVDLSSFDGQNQYICEDCDCYFEWCDVCQSSNYSDFQHPCRHLFWDDADGEWDGFGKDSWENGKEPFIAMLKMAGIEFAVNLRRSLLAHKYYFQFCSSIFGAESIDSQLLLEDGKMDWSFNGPLNHVFRENDQELAAKGISWLMTLWAGCDQDNWETPKTIHADLVAAGWCDEFISEGVR